MSCRLRYTTACESAGNGGAVPKQHGDLMEITTKEFLYSIINALKIVDTVLFLSGVGVGTGYRYRKKTFN